MTQNQRKFIRALHQKKYRDQEGLFLVEGEKIVLELLQAKNFQIRELYASADFIMQQTKLLSKVVVVESSPKNLTQASTFKSNQTAIAVVEIPTTAPTAVPPKGLSLILEDLRDPGNLGTILRIADWYAVPQIICSPSCVERYNPKVIAASMGSFLRVSVAYTALIPFLEKQDIPILGTTLSGKSLHEYSFPESAFLVIGSESHGISEALQQKLTAQLTIPRFGEAESLNAGVATAIFCDAWRRG